MTVKFLLVAFTEMRLKTTPLVSELLLTCTMRFLEVGWTQADIAFYDSPCVRFFPLLHIVLFTTIANIKKIATNF